MIIIYDQTKLAVSIYYGPVIVLSSLSTLSYLTYQPYKKLTPKSAENMPGQTIYLLSHYLEFRPSILQNSKATYALGSCNDAKC